MSTKKKVIVLVSMVLLLALTTTLNIVLGLKGTGGGDTPTAGAAADFFSEQRLETTTRFDSLMKYYDAIINNATVEEVSAKQDAVTKQLALLQAREKEVLLDTAIKSMGFADCLVNIDTTTPNVYVYIKAANLAVEDMKNICGVICNSVTTIVDTDIIFTQVP